MFAKAIEICLVVFCCTQQIDASVLKDKPVSSVDPNLIKAFDYPVNYNPTGINKTSPNRGIFEETLLSFKSSEEKKSTGNQPSTTFRS